MDELLGGSVRSDAIYRFVAWLTCRDKVIEVGASKDAAPMAEAVAEFFDLHPEPPHPHDGLMIGRPDLGR